MDSRSSEIELDNGINASSSPARNQFVSPAMQALEHVLADIAITDIPVLVIGESGTGKEVVARRIHQLSGRRHGPFVKLSCATIAPDSFAWRHDDTENGEDRNVFLRPCTVFLDEIYDLEPAAQSRLLHALPDGSAPPENCLGARVISATSRNVEEQVRAGRFREDLYYRLDGVCLRLPPLRHRTEDIPILVDFFLAKYAALFGRTVPTLSARTLHTLLGYSWPGNIRELENAVKKMVALGDEHAAVADLGSALAGSGPRRGSAERVSLKEAGRAASHQAERELILKVLTRTRWNRKRAAQDLQISYKALLYKLKQFGLDQSADSEVQEENPHE